MLTFDALSMKIALYACRQLTLKCKHKLAHQHDQALCDSMKHWKGSNHTLHRIWASFSMQIRRFLYHDTPNHTNKAIFRNEPSKPAQHRAAGRIFTEKDQGSRGKAWKKGRPRERRDNSWASQSVGDINHGRIKVTA